LDAVVGLTALMLSPPSSIHVCQKLLRALSCLEAFGTFIAKAILLLRTRAIWENSNRVFLPLLILYFVLLVAGIVTLLLFLKSQTFLPLAIWPHCQVSSRNGVIVWSFVTGWLFETVVMAFTGIKAYQHWRLGSRGLLYVIYRDGFLFYVYFVVINTASVVLFLSLKGPLASSMTSLQRILSAILSYRLLINMRKAAVNNRFKSGSTTLAPPSEGIELTTLHDSMMPSINEEDDVLFEDSSVDREFESVSWWMGEESVRQ